MIQDNSPEPQNNQPEPTVTPPARSVQPVWKSTMIQILRGTIGILETTVEKLETAPSPSTGDTPSFLQQLSSRWSRFLLKSRAFIPSNLSTKLSDTALTGIIAGIAVILVWTTTSIFTNKPTEVATVPPVEEIPTPTPTITTQPEPAPTAEITPEPSPTTEVSPEPATQLPPPEPEPTPTPTPVLTPEQTLIAAIEKQLREISDDLQSAESDRLQRTGEPNIPPGLIKSIQANFRTSSLTIKINDDWYTLKESQQNNLASQILQRSQELDFSHLEMIDSQDRLIARNPVIGDEMIILQRRTRIKP
ncbi:hypothetical protein [Nostoc sp. TCL26-01]|uniref:hypothetical protein n=1 Tax=Nostoc sp. TCL26-01 TaxID=2576904 RepID=UPI0015BF5D1C|nr:hypothetical protein [Nostoc sp. TCL26-01]QLE57397.1 hypothetical protein FD725_18850 [Nostoc sp. TCL26-01]